jgi:hypothetical protein
MLCAYSPTCCSSASRSTTSIRCDRRPVAAVPPALNAQTTPLRRLIGSSVVVGPASMSRRHERPPCWMAVSRRSGESRPPRWAARYKAGWGLDPHRLLRSNRRTWPAHCLLCQFGLARLVSAGRRAELATPGDRREGPLGPTLAGPSAAAAPCWERDTRQSAGASGARTVGGAATYRLRRCCTAGRVPSRGVGEDLRVHP